MIDLYDVNVYCDGDVLFVTAYELKQDKSGAYATNTDRYATLPIPMVDENHQLIAYLLDNEEWQEQEWEDYDFWHTVDYLIEGNIPPRIAEFVTSLPFYAPVQVEVF
jgi:2-polyprenyl-6-methoxyphenol hydroxylase-like FAD-dependent oxidoreductase